MAIQDKQATQVAVRDDAKLITVSPGRPPYPVRAQAAFGISPGDWRALVDAIYPNAKTTEAIELALTYCRARKLDPFKRQCHIVPIWDSKLKREVETIWPGLSELRTTAVRTNQMAGWDEAVFGPDQTLTFKGATGGQYSKDVEKTVTFPLWCQMTAYRIVDGQRCPFPGPKVRYLETYATMGASDVPNEMWATRPYGQLEKCAEAAALRRAFPEEVGSDYIPEEVGRSRFGQTTDVTPAGPPGSKTKALADRLKSKEEPKPEDEVQGEPEDEGGQGGGGEEAQVGERLSESQVKEIRAAVLRAGISLDELEGKYGEHLEEIEMPGMNAVALEEDIVRTILEMTDAARGAGQLPLSAKKK